MGVPAATPGVIRNTLTLSGLSAGSYTWTGYHGHQDKTSRRMIIDVLVGTTVMDEAVSQADRSTTTFADGFGLSSFTFTSTGADVVIGFQKKLRL